MYKAKSKASLRKDIWEERELFRDKQKEERKYKNQTNVIMFFNLNNESDRVFHNINRATYMPVGPVICSISGLKINAPLPS